MTATKKGDFEQTRTRRTDPETSRQAARCVKAHVPTHIDYIRNAMMAKPPMTAEQIAELIESVGVKLGRDTYFEVSRRLKDMAESEMAEKTGNTATTRTGRQAQTWRVK